MREVTLKQIIFSWDFGVSLLVTAFLSFVLKDSISSELAKDIYGVGISVLSIIFSVFFAALALIITSGDDDFVHFLEEGGDYTGIIATFRFSLLSLFAALVYSIVVYTFTAAQIYQKGSEQTSVSQPEFLLWAFIFLFAYGLLASLRATLDSITYALFRTKFLKIKQSQSEQKSDDSNA